MVLKNSHEVSGFSNTPLNFRVDTWPCSNSVTLGGRRLRKCTRRANVTNRLPPRVIVFEPSGTFIIVICLGRCSGAFPEAFPVLSIPEKDLFPSRGSTYRTTIIASNHDPLAYFRLKYRPRGTTLETRGARGIFARLSFHMPCAPQESGYSMVKIPSRI